jgi:hypothetical protein
MKPNSLIFLLIVCFTACSSNAYDAEKVAEDYCDCMRVNDAIKDYNKASLVCDSKLVEDNRYIKLYGVDMRTRELDDKVSDETRDSVQLFIGRFRKYINANCCKETLNCHVDSTDTYKTQ